MSNAIDHIENIVVLMMENRSFDNILGVQFGLDTSPATTTYNEYVNTQRERVRVNAFNNAGTATSKMTIPDPDPGELFQSMNQQVFGYVQEPPIGTQPPGPQELGAMGGFAQNYHQVLRRDDNLSGAELDAKTRNIMHCFTPDQVQASSALASSFFALQTYHASAPCQTLPNRCFAQLGTANGFVNNKPFKKGATVSDPKNQEPLPHLPYEGQTIFRAISEANNGTDWRVYAGDFPLTLAMLDTWDYLFEGDHFRPFEDFLADAPEDKLPAYTWIEPRYLIKPNDSHPPYDVTFGEILIAQVYNALRQNEEVWKKTLLVVTYDEHGGCFDRKMPCAATPPGGPYPDGFTFDRYGARVPTILCTPWIKPSQPVPAGTPPPDGPIYDHTSILKMVRSRFQIGGTVHAREQAANNLADLLDVASETELNLGLESISAGASLPDDIEDIAIDDVIKELVVFLAHLVPTDSKVVRAIETIEHIEPLRKLAGEAIRDLEHALDGVFDKIKTLLPSRR